MSKGKRGGVKIKVGERCRKCGRKIPDDDGVSVVPRIGGRLAWYHLVCWRKKQPELRDLNR